MARKKTTRRKHNEGSIYKKREGLWCGVANLGTDENGKRNRKYIYGHTEDEVKIKLERITGKVSSLRKEAFTNSVCDLMHEWLMVIKKPTVTSRTFENQIRNYRIHIKPYLRNMEIYDVDIIIINKVLNEINSKDVKRKVKYLLEEFFDYAIEQKLIQYNPVASVKLKTIEKKDLEKLPKKYKAIKPENRQVFLDALVENPFLMSLCLVGYYSGLRIGEILALRWKDVDFENKTINIEHAISIDIEFDEQGKIVSRKTILTEPKTGTSKAIVPMPDILSEILLKWKNEQNIKGKELKRNITQKKDYIFCKDDGTIRTYKGTYSIFERFLKKNNLWNKGIHFHGLRHTFATILKENKLSLYDIQALLRHSKATTTELYLSNSDAEAVKLKPAVNNIFNNLSTDENDFEYEEHQRLEVKKNKSKDFEM